MTYRTFKDLNDIDSYVAQAVQGDRAALERIVKACQHPVYHLAQRFLFDAEDAQDATQEILIKLCTRLHAFRGESLFATWLYRIATNHLLNAKRGRYEGLSIEEGLTYLQEGMQSPVYTGADAQLLEAEVKLGCTTSLLVCLSREQRLAYLLTEILDFSGPEAARMLEIPEPLLRKRLQMARKHVRGFFERQCGVFNPANPCRCARQITYNLESGWLEPDKPRFSNGWSPAQIEQITQALDEVENEVTIYRNPPASAPPHTIYQAVVSALSGTGFLN